jgi:hypothetical protein
MFILGKKEGKLRVEVEFGRAVQSSPSGLKEFAVRGPALK